MFCFWVCAGKSSRYTHSCSHAKAGIYHIKGMGVSKRITADISRENRVSLSNLSSLRCLRILFKLFCRLLECIKNSPVHAAGTESRSPDRQRRKLFSQNLRRSMGKARTLSEFRKYSVNAINNNIYIIFPAYREETVLFSININRKVSFS